MKDGIGAVLGPTDEERVGEAEDEELVGEAGEEKLPVQVAARTGGTSIILDGHTDEE